jgi:Haem-binding domain
MKAVKIVLLALAVIFIAIQFIPGGLPENKPEDERSLVHSDLVTENVMTQLRTSCFDCHSNQTSFPWYSKLAPTSWWLAGHINDGKSHLNFSEWEDNSRREKIGLLEEIKGEVDAGKMPLKSYLIVHRDARLNAEEVAALVKWTEDATSLLLAP